jgi:hypothetical protein
MFALISQYIESLDYDDNEAIKKLKETIMIIIPQAKDMLRNCKCDSCENNLQYLNDLMKATTTKELRKIQKDFEGELFNGPSKN